MTKEERELLVKDLCARLPYEVKFRYNKYITSTLTGVLPPYRIVHSTLTGNECLQIENDEIKPYLFPLSSMTEEQKYDFYCRFIENETDYDDFKEFYFENNEWHKMLTSIDDCDSVVDWFNKYHFDYRGLIPKDLAIDASYLNIY